MQTKDEAKLHLLLALEQIDPLPPSDDTLIEKIREYFHDQKVPVFQKLLFELGEFGFRNFIKQTRDEFCNGHP